jgi:transposase
VKLEKQMAKLEGKLAQKNEVLAELMEEHVKLKKSLGEI